MAWQANGNVIGVCVRADVRVIEIKKTIHTHAHQQLARSEKVFISEFLSVTITFNTMKRTCCIIYLHMNRFC